MNVSIQGLLRRMEERDLQLVLAWRNHPDVRCFMFNSSEITWDEHVAWFASASRNARKHLLVYESDDVLLGFVNFSECAGRVVEWGFHAAPQAPKGTGKRMLGLALEYGFTQLRVHKVSAQVLEGNPRSLALHGRLGFTQEGCLREQHCDGVGYQSVYCFGLLEHEWRIAREQAKTA
ncbi:UDP-4-amino-4,6-dideoxy-N-acetyl-beta-L-altrosamine N-acetyltransferase [Pseudomonas qingdaonensis]|uniref:UDP-4-amino-4, 6-dideoxy-N-acetyl-beta-L-altrosamine N-acetyltransferase n=1 Tax=Pseudomonas qingdaonensis TaxID=2056231 RepID=UPI002E194A93|nr:UDP-4-amino-4,6-dideoxy-N-acetyl-beta-L-altrosamine N-acetyltransferase [Pseudomonas qingdaonensis]